MASARDTLLDLLKTNGYSTTQARLAVFDTLLDKGPLSMHELVLSVPTVDRASVYRTVELYEQLGIIQRINTGWKYKVELSDLFTGHHHHLTCLTCGKTTAIDESALEDAIVQLAGRHGFTATAHQIELQGYCKQCGDTTQAQARL